MARLRLDFHGTTVGVESEAEGVLDALRRDFAFFAAPGGGETELAFTLAAAKPPSGSHGRTFLRGPGWQARDAAGVRLIRYADDALALFDYAAGRGAVYCVREPRLHELAYLAILSRAGEALDRRGLHRVHALGFEAGGQAGLLLLGSGKGKSTLALELLAASKLNILSDDTPLVCRRGLVHPFPLRWGFRGDAALSGVPEGLIRPFQRARYGPKRLVDVSYFRDRVGSQAPLRWLLVGGPGAAAGFRPLGAAPALGALALGLVVGHGVAQMAEYTLRAERLGLLARIAAARAATAAALVGQARLARFDLGTDPRAAAAALAAFVEGGR